MTIPTPPQPARFVEAGPFWRRALRCLGAVAITMPWRRVYVLPEHFEDTVLRRHETIHLEQIERDGVVLFCLRYVWWTARYGYWENPYEIEAYAREHEQVAPPAQPSLAGLNPSCSRKRSA